MITKALVATQLIMPTMYCELMIAHVELPNVKITGFIFRLFPISAASKPTLLY